MRSLAALLFALLLAGCLNTFEETTVEDPHYVRIVTVDVSPDTVLSQAVILNVTTTLDNRGGGASDPIRLEVKAYSTERGFLLTENETDVGPIEGDTTREVPLFLQVPREGGTRLEVALYEADLGIARATVTASNLGGLEPEVLDTGLRVSGVDFIVVGVSNETGSQRAQIRTDLYITNEGDRASEDLQVQVKAREAATSLVADVGWLATGSIAAGSTSIRSINMSVPDEYNYIFEILTWRGDVIVARSEGNVQLAPTFVKPNDTEIVTTDPRLTDFVTPTTSPTGYPGYPGYPYATGEASYGGSATPRVPGLGVGVVLALALALSLALRRRKIP